MQRVVFLSVMLLARSLSGQASSDLTVTSYTLVTEEVRISRTVSDFEYRVDIVNRGAARTAVAASVTSRVSSVQVLRGTLHFPSVPANAKVTSNDTILLRVDRSVLFDASNLEWTFSGAAVPVANAGLNQTAVVGSTVLLNGGASSSPTGGGPLSYNWTFLSRPTASAATLINKASVNPSFVADLPGTYTIQVTVTNSAGSSQATVTVSTLNSAPVAKAGPNQSVPVGSTVQLNGSGSFDVDGDALSFTWTFLTRPAGSTATLSAPFDVRPTFTADKAGNYEIQLIVTDGKANSGPSTVVVSTLNTRPVANPGGAQTVNVGSVVQLNGAGSTDVDGDLLTYEWSLIAAPEGSAAVLTNPVSVNPSFTADRPGTYVVQLIVDDGKLKSASTTVTVSTNTVQAPTASAGTNQTVKHGATVVLGGSGSDPQSLSLTFQWSMTTKPPGSNATLFSTTFATSGFIADRPGTYVAQFVTNNGYLKSPPATVTITTTNTAPVGSPGTNQISVVGSTVSLDGSGSTDADGDPISYFWSFLSKPTGSSAVLVAPGSITPSFVPDILGTYVVQLVVTDAYASSDPATVTILVSNRGVVMLPSSMFVELGRTLAFPVSLSAPAQAGGVTIFLSSSDPARVTLSPSSVFVAPGAATPAILPTITGTGLGPVSVSGAAAGYSPTQTQVRGSATISFSYRDLVLDERETKQLMLTLSGPAPVGGTSLTLLTETSGIASTPASVVIPQTLTTVSVPVTGVKAGTVVLRATSPELADATVSVTVRRRDILLPTGVVVPPGELVTFPVSLAAPAPEATFVSLTSSDPAKVTVSVPFLFFNQGQTQPTSQPKVSGAAVGTATLTAAAIGLNAATTTVQTGFSLAFSTSDVSIAGGATESLSLTLLGPPLPAPFSVNLTSSNPAIAAVPQTVFLASGTNSASVPVTGVNVGSAIIRAYALNTGDSFASITVTGAGAGQILLPQATAIKLGQTVPFPLTLSAPAPAGGITVSLASSDAGILSVSPSALVISGGQTQPETPAQITGNGVGTVAVTAAAAGYTSVSRTIQVTAIPAQIIAFSGANQSAIVGTNFTAPLIVAIRDAAGNSVAGVPVIFQSAASGPGGVFENGQNIVTTNISGFATSATFTANGTAGSHTVTASVEGVPSPAAFSMNNLPLASGQDAISVTSASVGNNLQTPVTVSLSRPAPSGGLRVNLSSGNPSIVLLGARPNDAGRATISFSIGEGLSAVTGIYAQGMQSSGEVSITASADGWSPGTSMIEVAPSGFVITVPNAAAKQQTTVGQGDAALLTVASARLDHSLNFVEVQPLRGDTSVTVMLTNTVPSVGLLSSASVTLSGGEMSSGLTFNASTSATGQTNLAAVVPAGFSRPGNGADLVTAMVVAASVIPPNLTVGEHLQVATTVRLTAPAPAGGTTLTVVSSNPEKFVLSKSETAAGSASIQLDIPAGRITSQDFYVQGLSNNGHATLVIHGDDVSSATGVVTMSRSGFVMNGPFGMGANFVTTSGAEPAALSITSAMLDSNLAFAEAQSVRGGLSIDVAITNGDSAVGALVGSPIRIDGGSSTAAATFRPSGIGTTVLALIPPAGFATPASGSSLTATVRAPGMLVTTGVTIGKNLQSIGTVLIGQTAPAGGLQVTLQSSSSLLALSAIGTAAGSTTLILTIPPGETSASYYLQAAGDSGVVTYTASATGFESRSASVALTSSGVVIAGPFGLGYTLLAKLSGSPQPAAVMTAALDPLTHALVTPQPLAGGKSLKVFLTNSDPLIGTVPGSVTIAGGASSALANFTPLAVGSTSISVEPPAGSVPLPFSTLSVTVWD